MPLKEKMKTYTERFSPMCWFRKHSSVWIALFASVILVLCYWKFGSYCWETNDDAFLAGISYGYHGSYDSHLIYINTLYGRLLNCFQSLLPSLPWYLIVEYGILVGSIGALFYLVLERWRGWTGILPIAVFVAFFAGYFLGFLQYTKVAGIASAAGILLLFHGVEKRKNWPVILAALLLSWLGFCLRKMEFLMLLAPLFGVGVYELWCLAREKEFGKIKKLFIVFLVLFAGCACLEIVDWNVYRKDPQWQAYETYNAYRTELLDYGFPDYEKNRELYSSLNISESDLELFKAWDFDDPEVFNIDAMKQLVDAREKDSLGLAQIVFFLRVAFREFKIYTWFPAIICALLLLFFFEERKSWGLAIYEIFALFAIEVYLLYCGRALKGRVDAPLFLTVFFVIILFCCNQKKAGETLHRKSILLLSLFTLFSQFSIENVRTNESTERIINSIHLYDAYQVLSTDRDTMYFTRCGDLPDDYYPGKMGGQGFLSNVSYLGGWLTQSPITNEKKAAYGITNPYRDMVDSDHIRLMSKDVLPVVTYIRGHYAPEAEAVAVRMVNGEFPVYRIVTGAPDASEKTMVPCQDGQWHLELTEAGSIIGYLYRPGINSFAADIYLGMQPEGGEERFYYTLQTILPENQGLMEGGYSCFSVNAQEMETGTYHVFLYLEVKDTCYQVDAGMLTLN